MKRVICFFFLAILSFTSCVFPEELAPRDIVDKSEQLTRADSNYGVYEIQVITPSWQRTMRTKAWELGRNKCFISIIYPAEDKGKNFLKNDYNMWQYIPKIERTIKIPPSMMRDAWMGSDFTNDDLVKESNMVKDYNHILLGEEGIGGNEAYKIELIPKPEAPVVWGKLYLWVRKGDYVPLRKEYYDEQGVLERVLTFSAIKHMDGRDIPTVLEMEPQYKKGRKTIFRILEIHFNKPIEANIFSLQNLKRQQK